MVDHVEGFLKIDCAYSLVVLSEVSARASVRQRVVIVGISPGENPY